MERKKLNALKEHIEDFILIDVGWWVHNHLLLLSIVSSIVGSAVGSILGLRIAMTFI